MIDYSKYVSKVLRQPKDDRDLIYQAPGTRAILPPEYMNPSIDEIENQLSTGSCVANATCSSLEMMTHTENPLDFSRLFVYYNAREPYPNLKEVDAGAYVRDGYKSVNKLGVCTEDIWKFDVTQVNTRPDDESYLEAEDNRVTRYESVANNIDLIKSAIVAGNGVIYGTGLHTDFYKVQGPLATQTYAGVQPGTPTDGYHAMSIVGYNDNLGGFIVENSWGEAWGDKGLFLSKYEDFTRDSFDIWTCSGIAFGVEPEVEKEDNIIVSFFKKIIEFFKGLF